MPLRPDEHAAIDDLVVYLSRQRNTTFDGREGADPPDWICEDRATKAVIAIEHTRIEPRDLVSEDQWKQLHGAIYQRAKGVVPGLFFVGQTRPDQRFPATKKVPVAVLAQKIVDATAQRQWSQPGETWEVSPTQAPQRYVVKVMLVDPNGSEMWGLPPFGHRHPHEVIMRFREALEQKTADLYAKAPSANEHVLLIDVTSAHAAALRSYVEHLIDVMESLRLQSLPVPTSVYFRGKDASGNIEIRTIWLWPG